MAWLTDMKVNDRVCVTIKGQRTPYTIIRVTELCQEADSFVKIWSSLHGRGYTLRKDEQADFILDGTAFSVKSKGRARRPEAQMNTACMCFIGDGMFFKQLNRGGPR